MPHGSIRPRSLLCDIVARMERSEIRESRDAGPGLRFALSGLQPLTTRLASVICPSGRFLRGPSSLISDFTKNISVPTYPSRVIPGCSLLLVCVLPIPSAHEAAGATGIRRSPRPPRGERFINGSGAWRGEGAKSRLGVIASEAKQSIKPQRKNGLLRFARNDGSTIESSRAV